MIEKLNYLFHYRMTTWSSPYKKVFTVQNKDFFAVPSQIMIPFSAIKYYV